MRSSSVEVTATDGSSVTIAWPPSRDSDVVGYGVYLNGAQVGTQTPDQVKRWRDRDAFSYTIEAACLRHGLHGWGGCVRSWRSTTRRSPRPRCPPRPARTRRRPRRRAGCARWRRPRTRWCSPGLPRRTTSAWSSTGSTPPACASRASATRARRSRTSSCGTSYLVAIDAADAAGNRSAQASSFYRTSACPSTNKPPSTPTLVQVAKTTQTTVALSWTASTDDVAVTGYGLYLSGSRTSETTGTTGRVHGAQVRHDLHARRGRKRRRRLALRGREPLHRNLALLAPPPPSSTGAVTQTIANGSTIVGSHNWRAVYDANGDRVEDDPGSIQFLVDGNQVLSEINAPFGDTFAVGADHHQQTASTPSRCAPSTTAGTLLATNTVTATVANQHTTTAAAELDGRGDADDRERVDVSGSRTGAPSTTPTATGRGRPRLDPVPRRRQPGAVRDQPALRRHRRLLASTTVTNGPHTFQVRALNDSGTVLATNTITATVANHAHHRRPVTRSLRRSPAI